MITANLNSTGVRWVAQIAVYNCTVKYQPIRRSLYCDYLLWHLADPQCYTKSIDISSLNAMTSSISAINDRSNILDLALVANINTTNLKDKDINVIDSKSLVNDQINDKVVGPAYNAVNLYICSSLKQQGAIPEKLDYY